MNVVLKSVPYLGSSSWDQKPVIFSNYFMVYFLSASLMSKSHIKQVKTFLNRTQISQKSLFVVVLIRKLRFIVAVDLEKLDKWRFRIHVLMGKSKWNFEGKKYFNQNIIFHIVFS